MNEQESCEYLVSRLAEVCQTYNWLLAVHSGENDYVDGVMLGEASVMVESIKNGWDVFDMKGYEK